MKTTTIVIATLAVGIALILSFSLATSAMGYPIASSSQSRGGYGMIGNNGYGSMMGGYGGMMGGGASSSSGYGGMMGGFGSTGSYTGHMMGDYNGTFGYIGSMMRDAYGNFTSWCNQFISQYFEHSQK